MIQISPNSDKTFSISLWIDEIKVKSRENIPFSEIQITLDEFRKYLTPY